MSYLTDLASGLRSAAGVLNPTIQKQQVEEEQLNAARQERQAQFLFSQLAKQVEGGSLSAEQAAQAARARGVQVDPAIFGGPSLEAQAKAVALQKEQRKAAILQHPEVRGLIETGNLDRVNDILVSAGVLDPLTVAEKRRDANKPITVAPGATVIRPDGTVIGQGTPREKPPIKIDRFPVGNGMVQPHISLDGGVTFQPVSGSRPIAAKDVSGSTTVNVQNGPMALGKPAQGKVDENLLETTQNLMRLDQISAQFKPEYQTYATKGANWWSGIKASAGRNLPEGERKSLEEFSAYRRNAINALNEYIKSITGAAMSNAEAERILKGMPNPGQGIFDGDDPVSFKAKLDDTIKAAKLAAARLTYIKRNGLSLTDASGNPVIPLERMPSLMNERGKQIEAQLRERDTRMTLAEIQKATRRQLAQEFGLIE